MPCHGLRRREDGRTSHLTQSARENCVQISLHIDDAF
jgi:hypothetical protein